ncbi:transcription termination factor MTERF4, chloroplastic [Tanacetum coccineum]
MHHEISTLTFYKPLKTATSAILIPAHHQTKFNFVKKLQCSVSSRPYTSTSKSYSTRTNRKQGSPSSSSSSLYGCASLLEMKNERIANRARVYEFLRSIGIEPDELDGLELPVTVDVMKERVDFLHTLGLTVEDINNYPLVLGCSVKKNMVPVLDYLGKLGVRRSTLTDFLRRYPQVLHASVVVDLNPVVKYLEDGPELDEDLNFSLAWASQTALRSCNLRRGWNYDTNRYGEMEDVSSFDMNSLMEPRNNGSDSEYDDEDSDEEYL